MSGLHVGLDLRGQFCAQFCFETAAQLLLQLTFYFGRQLLAQLRFQPMALGLQGALVLGALYHQLRLAALAGSRFIFQQLLQLLQALAQLVALLLLICQQGLRFLGLRGEKEARQCLISRKNCLCTD